jgi:DNA-binding transcriptional ArsR family regulator
MANYHHPDADRIELAAVLEALSDSTRLAIVAFLSSQDDETFESACGGFTAFGSKSNITYHLAKLREAGVTQTRVAGTSRMISLRSADLEKRFPGLLRTLVAAALAEPERAAMVARAQAEAKMLETAG